MSEPESQHKWRRWRDLPRAFAATTGSCPNCLEGRIFKGWWRPHETCQVCGVRFERDQGAWLGAMVVSYIFAVIGLFVLAVALILRWGLFPGLEWVLVGAGVLLVVLLYRPSKGLWTWWLWGAGFLVKDGEQPPG